MKFVEVIEALQESGIEILDSKTVKHPFWPSAKQCHELCLSSDLKLLLTEDAFDRSWHFELLTKSVPWTVNRVRSEFLFWPVYGIEIKVGRGGSTVWPDTWEYLHWPIGWPEVRHNCNEFSDSFDTSIQFKSIDDAVSVVRRMLA